MTLDLGKVGPQIREMGEELGSSRDLRRAQLERVRAFFQRVAPDWARMAERARATGRSAAAPLDRLDAAYPRPSAPDHYEVLATDGSSIEPDRHGPAICALVNVGRARIRYGATPVAQLDSQPALYFRAADLYVQQAGRRMLLRERLLDARRSLAEMAALSELAAETEGPNVPRIALADGLLTIWRDDWVAADPDEVAREFREALDRIAHLRLPLAAYVSNPASHWVVDLLREESACHAGPERCSLGCGDLRCALEGFVDAHLYSHLAPGDRSGLLEVVGQQQDQYGSANRSHFFYLNGGREVARVEVPAWAAHDQTALHLVHGIVYDQVERGQGYPVALARAHEQAVITGRDRQAFQQLVVESLARAGLPTGLSEKQTSKNLRAV